MWIIQQATGEVIETHGSKKLAVERSKTLLSAYPDKSPFMVYECKIVHVEVVT